jgi:hypothetical protein
VATPERPADAEPLDVTWRLALWADTRLWTSSEIVDGLPFQAIAANAPGNPPGLPVSLFRRGDALTSSVAGRPVIVAPVLWAVFEAPGTESTVVIALLAFRVEALAEPEHVL